MNLSLKIFLVFLIGLLIGAFAPNVFASDFYEEESIFGVYKRLNQKAHAVGEVDGDLAEGELLALFNSADEYCDRFMCERVAKSCKYDPSLGIKNDQKGKFCFIKYNWSHLSAVEHCLYNKKVKPLYASSCRMEYIEEELRAMNYFVQLKQKSPERFKSSLELCAIIVQDEYEDFKLIQMHNYLLKTQEKNQWDELILPIGRYDWALMKSCVRDDLLKGMKG